MSVTINLYTDLEKGKTKEYKAKKLSSLYIMKTMRIGKKLEQAKDDLNIELVDELLDLIVEVYNNQFTLDELLSGIPAEDFMDTLQEQMVQIASPKIDSDETKDFLEKK